MLRTDQHGLIVGLVLIAVFLFIIFTVVSNTLSSSDDSSNNNDDSSVIDQAKGAAKNVNDTGNKANSLLDGLTGN